MIFEAVGMRCAKRPRSALFGFIKWLDGHELEAVRTERWGAYSWRLWEVTVRCKACGATFNRFGINEASWLRQDFWAVVGKG
jgi:hypothetical protein